MKINITGAAYEHASRDTNFQKCINMYPMDPGPEGRGFSTLVPRWGKTLATSLTNTSSVRGLLSLNNILYSVGDDVLFKIEIDPSTELGTATSIGNIEGTSGSISMASNGTQIIIVDGTTKGWIYTPKTFAVVTPGPIGGTASDTYSLYINNIAVIENRDVSTALSLTTLINLINNSSDMTNVHAASGGTGIITLTNVEGDDNILLYDTGEGFIRGTDGLTISSGPFYVAVEDPITGLFGIVDAFHEITSDNFLGGSSVVYLDGYFFLSKPDSNIFYASQLNDGDNYDALDFATSAITFSNIVSLQVKNRELWIFKEDAVEVWYDAANPTGMPLSPRVGSELSIGCLAPSSIVSIDNTLYWLDSRRLVSSAVTSDQIVNQNTGNVAKPVSSEALNNAFASYSTIFDATGIGYQERGHLMYQITFPTMNKTWVFDITTGTWHERQHYNPVFNNETYDLAEFALVVNGVNIVASRLNGDIYLSNSSAHTDNGDPIRCTKTTQPFSQEFKAIGIDVLEIKCGTGYSNSTDTYYDPYISMRYSNDSGHTWSNEQPRSLGKIGEWGKRIIWNRLGTSYEWMFEFVVVAAIDWALIEADAKISEIEEL